MSANGPYTFGFIDSLVRINFPQKAGKFLTTDSFGNYFYSDDGKKWNFAHSDFLSSDNGGWLGSSYGFAVTNDKGVVTTKAAFFLAGTDGNGSDNTFAVTAYSFDLKKWVQSDNGGPLSGNTFFSIPIPYCGFDTDQHLFWVSFIVRQSSPDAFQWLLTSPDAINWSSQTGPAFVDNGIIIPNSTTWQVNEKTGTQITPGGLFNLHSIIRTPKGGSTDIMNLGGRRIADTGWSPVGSGNNGTWITTGGGGDSFGDGGPQIFYSTDDGLTWKVGLDIFVGGFGGEFSPLGCGPCTVGRKSKFP